MKKSTLTVFFILTGCLLFLSGIWIYFQKSMDQVDLGEGERAASYEKHYLMISSEDNALMWDSIYESASEAAKELDVYVELVPTGQGTDYDLEDYLRWNRIPGGRNHSGSRWKRGRAESDPGSLWKIIFRWLLC